jgi:hypothetical protein
VVDGDPVRGTLRVVDVARAVQWHADAGSGRGAEAGTGMTTLERMEREVQVTVARRLATDDELRAHLRCCPVCLRADGRRHRCRTAAQLRADVRSCKRAAAIASEDLSRFVARDRVNELGTAVLAAFLGND